jgi:hypothetical protein
VVVAGSGRKGVISVVVVSFKYASKAASMLQSFASSRAVDANIGSAVSS